MDDNKVSDKTTDSVDKVSHAMYQQKNKILREYKKIVQRNTRYFSLCAVASFELFIWFIHVAEKGNLKAIADTLENKVIPDLQFMVAQTRALDAEQSNKVEPDTKVTPS